MCQAEECCCSERLSLSGVQQVRTREKGGGGGSSLREIESEERERDREFSQAAFSLLANYAFKPSENFTVHTVHTCCMHSIMPLSLYSN